MDHNPQLEVFKAIQAFFFDLYREFNEKFKDKSLGLFTRLVQNIKDDETDRQSQVIEAVKMFFTIEATNIKVERFDLIHTQIKFKNSNSIYINFAKYYKHASEDAKAVLEAHLTTIYELIHPKEYSPEQRSLFESFGVDLSTRSGHILAEFLDDFISAAKNTENPEESFASFAQSGKMQKGFLKLKNAVESGYINRQEMLATITNAFTHTSEMLKNDGGDPDDLLNKIGAQLGLSAGDIHGIMNKLNK